MPCSRMARERFGRLDVVVNNAGGVPAADARPPRLRFHEGVIRLNLIAPLNVAQRANRIMQEQDGGGVIVFIGSISALRPSPGTAATALPRLAFFRSSSRWRSSGRPRCAWSG